MYEHTDKVLSALNRQYVRLYRKLKLLDFDELNVVNQAVSVYRQADRLAKKAYLDIAIFAYLFGLAETALAGFEADIPDATETPIDKDWIQDMLMEADSVTLYEYMPEWERKRQRLIEALAATNKPNQEIDKALKYVFQQVSHYADKATVKAVIQAFKDAGVKKVKWITEKDNRVCDICKPLDGKVFDIDKIIIPAHWRCRCRIEPVKV